MDVEYIEKYQVQIDKLYKKSPISKDEIQVLKIRRVKLMKRVLKVLDKMEGFACMARKDFLKDHHIPIDCHTNI